MLTSAIGATTQSRAGPGDEPWNDLLDDFAPLVGLTPSVQAPPADPIGALTGVVNQFLADLGFQYDASDELLEADLPPVLAGFTALALSALHDCFDETRSAVDSVGLGALVDAARRGDIDALAAADRAGLRSCALNAAQALVNLEAAAVSLVPTLAAAPPQNLVNIWPVLVIDQGGDDTYENDYILVLEMGGNDVHDNNAGSNMIDTRFAPASSPFPGIDLIPHVPGVNDGDDDRSGFGPSEGCAIALGSLLAGNCTPVAAALIELGGNDQYGVFKTPVVGVDARCTNDLVIRRMVTNGVGFTGFGMLLDTTGTDVYNGRTGSNGAGHIFGVGVLDDREGDDVYRDVRNAQGFSLIGNLGLLLDESGSDQFQEYMPSEKVPGTPNEQDGAGGVIDDENKCDNLPRFLQGAGDAVGVGVLIDRDGADQYTAHCAGDFGAPGDIGAPACGQGFGQTGGLGAFFDRGGDADSYTGTPGRGNNRVLIRVTPDVDVDASDPLAPTVERSTAIEIFADG